MDNQFSRITDESDLEELVARSETEPVIIFKHSTTCSISAAAYRELQQLGTEVHLIEVQRYPSVSEEIEKRTGLRHESPQVIVLRRGKVVWDASHWQIKSNAVETAVRDHH
jgi:bacillithiol system protein YtxJ